MIVRKFTNEEYRQIAQLHIDQIPGGTLTKLGPKFLTDLYKAWATSPYSFVLGWKDDQILGFICGTTDIKRLRSNIALRLMFPLIMALLKKPTLIASMPVRLIETFVYPNRTRPEVSTTSAEILNFCVQPQFHGKGIAKELFIELVGEFRRRGLSEFRISTGSGQLRAQRFYEKMGARKCGISEPHSGNQAIELRYANNSR